MATTATGQKVARRKKDAQSTKSSKPTEAQPPVQAAGGWLEQALLQRSCPEDHTPGTVLAQGGTSPYACRDVCSPTHLSRKVQLLRTSYNVHGNCLSAQSRKPRLCLPIFVSFKYWLLPVPPIYRVGEKAWMYNKRRDYGVKEIVRRRRGLKTRA